MKLPNLRSIELGRRGVAILIGGLAVAIAEVAAGIIVVNTLLADQDHLAGPPVGAIAAHSEAPENVPQPTHAVVPPQPATPRVPASQPQATPSAGVSAHPVHTTSSAPAPSHTHGATSAPAHVTPSPRPSPPPTRPPTPIPDPPPTAADDFWQLTAIYNTYEWIDFQVFDNDSDAGPTFPDGSPFRTSAVTSGQFGSVDATPVLCNGGTRYCLRYRAANYGPFTDTFTYTIVDVAGHTDQATVTITMPPR
jgi:hypothetical protein